MFSQTRDDYDSLNFFDAGERTRIELRNRAVEIYLSRRPDWYNRLQRNSGPFNQTTIAFIEDLIEFRLQRMWTNEKGAAGIKRKLPRCPECRNQFVCRTCTSTHMPKVTGRQIPMTNFIEN